MVSTFLIWEESCDRVSGFETMRIRFQCEIGKQVYSGWHATYRKLFVDENFLWTKRFCHLKSSVDSRLFTTGKLQILVQLLSRLCLFSCFLGNTTQHLVLEHGIALCTE